MKNVIIITLAIFALFACSKEDSPQVHLDGLKGFWLLTEITGGITGTGYEASFDHLQINDNNRYALMIHDAVLQEGDYELTEENDEIIIRFYPDGTDNIIFDDIEKAILISENDQELTLSDPCCDNYVYNFMKEGL